MRCKCVKVKNRMGKPRAKELERKIWNQKSKIRQNQSREVRRRFHNQRVERSEDDSIITECSRRSNTNIARGSLASLTIRVVILLGGGIAFSYYRKPQCSGRFPIHPQRIHCAAAGGFLVVSLCRRRKFSINSIAATNIKMRDIFLDGLQSFAHMIGVSALPGRQTPVRQTNLGYVRRKREPVANVASSCTNPGVFA